ncbi:MAG: pyruvate kinase, partial [Clostridia bacterium]|nr:pyruvate kinase [Clostridia bacterium]
RRMSKFRPLEPIICATHQEKTFNQLSLSWGVYPVLTEFEKDYNKLFEHSIKCAKKVNLVEKGDMVVITAGIPIDTSGNTNLLKVEKID